MFQDVFLAVFLASAFHAVLTKPRDPVGQSHGQFEGGTISFVVRNDSRGRLVADLDMLTGWVLNKGPCGSGCSRADIGRDTHDSRVANEQATGDPHYFGNWTSVYKVQHKIQSTNTKRSNMTEMVLRIDENVMWEQDLMKISVDLEAQSDDMYIGIAFEGEGWPALAMQPSYMWRMQVNVERLIRSDTGIPNRSPIAFVRPVYRILLNRINRIHIAAVDPDDDFVQCRHSIFVESKPISNHPLPGLHVHWNCTVDIDADEKKYNYSDGGWGAVALRVSDYNTHDITIGSGHYIPYTIGHGPTPVQFAVQFVRRLETPIFVDPTAEANRRFIIYSGAIWRQNVYAKAQSNSTISEFKAIGRKQEQIIVSAIDDGSEPNVKHAMVKWVPNADDTGHHIVCVTAVDSKGLQSNEDRCFIIEVRETVFSRTAPATTDRPFFIGLPGVNQTVECAVYATCTVPLYIKSQTRITRVGFTLTFLATGQFAPVTLTDRNGTKIYKTYLSVHDGFATGILKTVIYAIDENGHRSDEETIMVKNYGYDPCISSPCQNGGACIRSEDNPDNFTCRCFNDRFKGKYCEIAPDPCNPTPCLNNATCFRVVPNDFYCYCAGTPGTGTVCAVDPCATSPCKNAGTCVADQTNPDDYHCVCQGGYSGTNCEKLRTPCQPNPCVHGRCRMSGRYASCTCYPGYVGEQCDRAVFDCTKDPCVHGICEDLIFSSHCVCSQGYTGQRCDTKSP